MSDQPTFQPGDVLRLIGNRRRTFKVLLAIDSASGGLCYRVVPLPDGSPLRVVRADQVAELVMTAEQAAARTISGIDSRGRGEHEDHG